MSKPPLPNFLVIGAAKSGTSSIHDYLRAHPSVFTPKLKEINYFAYDPARHMRIKVLAKTLDEYRGIFAEVRDEQAIGEVAPIYLVSTIAPGRIKKTVPSAKLIAILRNPADRAWSAMLMEVREGRERLPSRKTPLDENSMFVRNSLYSGLLTRYFDLFPSEQIKIMLFEDFVQSPAREMGHLYRFLGVPAFHLDSFSVKNRGFIPRSWLTHRMVQSDFSRSVVKPLLPDRLLNLARQLKYINARRPPRIPSETRSRLLEFFRSDAEELKRMTGLDTNRWFQ